VKRVEDRHLEMKAVSILTEPVPEDMGMQSIWVTRNLKHQAGRHTSAAHGR
jgi:hypothetical protein